jgi:hypothetical protein
MLLLINLKVIHRLEGAKFPSLTEANSAVKGRVICHVQALPKHLALDWPSSATRSRTVFLCFLAPHQPAGLGQCAGFGDGGAHRQGGSQGALAGLRVHGHRRAVQD